MKKDINSIQENNSAAKKNNSTRLSDSASSHRYITGDYSPTNDYKHVIASLVKPDLKKPKKKSSKPKRILIGAAIFLFIICPLMGSLFSDDGPLSQLTYAMRKKPNTVFITKQLNEIQLVYSTMEKTLGPNYDKNYSTSSYEGGNDISFYAKYDHENILKSVSSSCNYEYDKQSVISENIYIRLEELMVNQGIKPDDRVKTIILAFSPKLPYDKIIAEETRLYNSVTKGKVSSTTTDFADSAVNITVSYKEEHRSVVISMNRDVKSTN